MHKIISRFGYVPKKIFSRCSKGPQYDMGLYDEKPQTSPVVRINEKGNNENILTSKFNSIRQSNTRIINLTESNYIALSSYSNKINTPVVIERFDNASVPATMKVADFLKFFAKTGDTGSKDPIHPGRLGRLDAANEAGFFHRTDRSRLREIKKKLKEKPLHQPTTPKKSE